MERRKLNRRDFLRLSVAAAAGAVVAACAPATPQIVEVEKEVPIEKEVIKEVPVEKIVEKEVPVEKIVEVAPKPAEPVQLRLTEGSWVGPEGITFWAEEVIGRFELENPGITVAFESAESPDYVDKLFTQFVAGDAPDVMFLWGWFNYDITQKGQLLELDEYFDGEYLADFNPTNLLAHQYEGHLYGLPKEAQSHTLAYNKDILDEAGVDYPDGTWNWDDYLAACQATTKRDDSGRIVQWGTYLLENYIFHWVWMNGGEWMNAPTYGTKALIDGEKAMEALKFLHDMIYGPDPVAPKIGAIADFGWWNVFSTGKIAFVESCSWVVTNYVRENDFRWDFADLPTARDGARASPTFASGHSVYKDTKHTEAALKLVEFMSSPWVQKQACVGIIGALPGRRSLFEQWDLNSMGARAGYDAAAFTRIQPYTGLNPIFQDAAKSEEIFDPIWDQIWVTGEMGLEEGIRLIVERINEYFGTA